MKKLLCFLMIVTLLSIFMTNSVSANTPPTTTVSDQGIGVPVIFDGKYYTAAEFEKIAVNVNVAVVTPDKTGTVLYAFSSLQGFAHHFDPTGTFKFISQEASDNKSIGSNIIKPLTEYVGYGYNWENINKGGSCLAVQEDYNRPDLSVYSPSWSYRISSCDFPYDSGKSSLYFMFLSYLPNAISGTVFAVQNGNYVPSLVSYYYYYGGSYHTWNDAACGIYWGTIVPK